MLSPPLSELRQKASSGVKITISGRCPGNALQCVPTSLTPCLALASAAWIPFGNPHQFFSSSNVHCQKSFSTPFTLKRALWKLRQWRLCEDLKVWLNDRQGSVLEMVSHLQSYHRIAFDSGGQAKHIGGRVTLGLCEYVELSLGMPTLILTSSHQGLLMPSSSFAVQIRFSWTSPILPKQLKPPQFAEIIFSSGNVIKVLLEEILWRKWKY